MSGKKKSKTKTKTEGELLSAVSQVARAARTSLGRNLLDVGLYAGQDVLMLALDRQDGQAPGAIAASLGVKAPTITKTISRLAAQGLVRRQDSPDDGRMSLVYLTDLGREKIKAISRAQKETEKQALDGLKNKDVKQLIALLSAIEANLGDPEKKPKGSRGKKAKGETPPTEPVADAAE